MGAMTTWSVRAVMASEALVRHVRPSRLKIGARALHAGLWLGLAHDDLLVAVDEATYARGRYAYHDTDSHNMRGLFPWEERALDLHFPDRGRLVLTSAGGGREVLALRQRGFEVTAFECNEQLRARANGLLARTGGLADVRPMPRDRCPPLRATYDGAIVGWCGYTFMRGTARRSEFLRALASALSPGAPVLLSFFVRTGDARRFRVVAGLGNAIRGLRGAEPVELGDVLDPTWQHYVDRAELVAELEVAGLKLIHWSTEGYGHAIARREPNADGGGAPASGGARPPDAVRA